VIYVQPEADDGQGDGAGEDAGGAGENDRVDEAVVTVDSIEAAATDVAEASCEPVIPHQMEV
jgi:hypothetical protein